MQIRYAVLKAHTRIMYGSKHKKFAHPWSKWLLCYCLSIHNIHFTSHQYLST